MEWPSLAVVEILFPDQILQENDGLAIETLLRKEEMITNLLIQSDKMTFCVWGKNDIDYKILDRIKEELQKNKKRNFVISAKEYKETGKKYDYASGKGV